MSIKSAVTKTIKTQSELHTLQSQNEYLAEALSFLVLGIMMEDIMIPFDKVKSSAIADGIPEDRVDFVINGLLTVLIPLIEKNRQPADTIRISEGIPSAISTKPLIILP